MEVKENNAQRVILHVDLNSFFATSEQQANPRLRGKPVGIVKAKGRACIIAASIEAKKYGVKTGSNVYDAKNLCPEIILVEADFDKYADITYRFIEICKSYSPICEVFSLDECFIDVTESEKFFGNVFNIAFEIKARLKNEVGDWMRCSVGVSHNRLLAKLASSQIKDDGLFWITSDNALGVLDKSDLMDVCGLGWGLYSHLLKLGIDSFPKIRECSFAFLHKNFGPFWSVHLYNISRGIDDSPVTSYSAIPDAKSVGRTYTAHRLLNNKDEVYRLTRNLCEEATQKARTMDLSGRYVGYMLRTSGRSWSGQNETNSSSWYGHRTLKNYISLGSDLFEICKIISKDWDFKNIIFCGVTLGMLTKSQYISQPIFETDRKKGFLTSAQDEINKKYGDYTVFPAQLLGMSIVMPEVTGYFGDKSYRLKYLNQ